LPRGGGDVDVFDDIRDVEEAIMTRDESSQLKVGDLVENLLGNCGFVARVEWLDDDEVGLRWTHVGEHHAPVPVIRDDLQDIVPYAAKHSWSIRM
jgi:hypothetical protein